MTMPDPYGVDEDNYTDTLTVTDEVAAFTPPLTVAAILADVDRQLADYPVGHDAEDVEMSSADAHNLEIMDAYVRAILAGASSRLSILNTALGHDPSLTPRHTSSPPPLTDKTITANIAEIYAYYYNDTSDEDEVPEPLARHTPTNSDSVPTIAAILTDVDQRLNPVSPATLALARYPYPFAELSTLMADPFFTTVFSASDFSVIRFPSGHVASCLTHDLNRTRTVYLSPDAPTPRPFRRYHTPRYVPESPPQESSSAPDPSF